MPVTKAWRAVVWMTLPTGPPIRWATASAAPSWLFIASAIGFGTGRDCFAIASPIFEPYVDASTLPMMAIPSAPPTWRVVSLTAEPTPAFDRGNDPMIDSVAGAIVQPMPAATSTIRHTMSP